jgi:uncharacterized protein YjbI with pentapeptide repeats
MLSLANLANADFSAAKLGEANLMGTQFKDGIFLEADFHKADLRGAVVTGAVVRDARFDGANFEGADLRGAIGLAADQVCSAQHWHAAQIDADVLAATQARCGAGAVFVGPIKP